MSKKRGKNRVRVLSPKQGQPTVFVKPCLCGNVAPVKDFDADDYCGRCRRSVRAMHKVEAFEAEQDAAWVRRMDRKEIVCPRYDGATNQRGDE